MERAVSCCRYTRRPFRQLTETLSAQPLDQLEGPPVHERFGSPAEKIFAVAAGGNTSMVALEVGS
jgi:hypothetical protein